MNYYERHLGDYAKDAGHLTMLEHGAYTLLLDRYYTTGEAIPKDQAYRLCRARSPDEMAAVDSVLAEFFVKDGSVYRNRRADQEIAKALVRIEAARGNGSKGGRPKANGNPQQTHREPTGLGLGYPAETQREAHHVPPNHLTNKATAKATVQQAAHGAGRFAEFWKAYPNKQGKSSAEKKWRSMKLDDIADTIIAHVQRMTAHDDGWQRGYIPQGSTYINGQRWSDEPKSAVTESAKGPGKQMQTLNTLQEMRDGMAGGRGNGGFPAFGLLGHGASTGSGGHSGNGNGLV